MNSKKGFLEISFGWLFAIIAGAFILFLAIFLAAKIINMEKTSSDVESSKEIGVLINPLETGFESDIVTALDMGAESRIYTDCSDYGSFGEQTIRVSKKSLGKWSQTNIDVSFQNKFIFSENPSEGKTFYLFSKPLQMPFKIADLIYVIPTNKKYCFVNAPEYIQEDLTNLNIKSINFSERKADCPKESTSVCFSGFGCNISVNMQLKTVKKESVVYFVEDSTMYAAVFSPSADYECQIKRIMKRISSLSEIYFKKALIVSKENCNTNIDVSSLKSLADGFTDSKDLEEFFSYSENLNKRTFCRLW